MSNENVITIQIGINLSASVAQFSSDDQVAESLGWPKWVRMDKVRRIANTPIQPHIMDKICEGEPTAEIARYVHGLGYFKSINQHSLISMIDHYKATIPKSMIFKRQLPAPLIKAAEDTRRRINVVDMMAWAVDVQKKRIEKYLEVENSSPIPIPETRKELDSFIKMTEKYQEIEDKAFGTGHLTPAPIVQAPIDMSKVYSKESVNKVLGDPVSRFKVVQAVERIVDLMQSRKEVDVTPDISVDSEEVLEDKEEVVELKDVNTHIAADIDAEVEDESEG